jgi:uncharacterized protein (DUF58 family)
MDSRIRSLLQPELLMSLNGLELIARIIVEGYMSGSNKSQTIGVGQEFSQYRNYEPGDDLRQLDWKMYARSERYFIKQAEIETNITVKLMLDASNSMAYSEEGVTKFGYAKVLCAAIAYLARKQGDAIGLSILNEERLLHVLPRFEQSHFMRYLHYLAEATPGSKWRTTPDVEQVLDHHSKELIIFITDLYDHAGDITAFAGRLKTRRNEVIVLHIMGRQELTMEIEGTYSFQDLETGLIQQIKTSDIRTAYKEKLNAWINEKRSWLHERDIHYYLVDMGSQVDEVLRNFLRTRKALM